MNLYDVIIIGAGVVGSSIARELSRYKLKIALLEKESEVAFGVSKSNSGIIHPGTQNPPHLLKARLCVQGNALTRKISRQLGVDFKEVGELIVAFNPEEIPVLIRLKKEAEAIGVPKLRIVGRGWLESHEPVLNKEIVAALYAPTAGIISPYRMVYALCENAVLNGAEVYVQTKVEGIALLDKSPQQNSPGFEISTSKGIFRTRYIVNAAGLFADHISGMLGINDFRIGPRKGEEFILDKKKQSLTNHLIFPLPSKASKGVLVIKTIDGNPMVGPSAEEVEDKEDLSTSDEGFKKVFSCARRLVPSIEENDIIAYFAGLRPVAGEDFIIRHESKAPGFVNAAGIQSPGLTAAPAIALLAREILKDKGLSLKKKTVFHCRMKKPKHLFSVSFTQAKRLIKKDAEYGDIVCRCEMVSAREIKDAVAGGAVTLDGIKFRTRAQAGRCHGSFCTSRIMKILAQEKNIPLTAVTKRGPGSEVVKKDRIND